MRVLCMRCALGHVLLQKQEVCTHDRDAFLFVVLPAWMFPHVLKSYNNWTVFEMLACVEHVSVFNLIPTLTEQ